VCTDISGYVDTGSMTGTVPVEDIAQILQQWLPPNIDCSEESIFDAYQKCSSRSGQEGDSANFSTFCSILDIIVAEGPLTGR
jgi:hypothetical protein